MTPGLTIRPLSREAFAPFGEVIEVSARPAKLINQGRTEKWADLARLELTAAGGRPALHFFRSQPTALPFLIEVMERHPLGSQAFIPLHRRPFLVVVAPPGPVPDGAGIRGFVTDGRQGVNYAPGTWHHFQLTLVEPGDYLVIDRMGPGDNLDEFRLPQPLCIESTG